jgi:uncharacterized cofD-like protein
MALPDVSQKGPRVVVLGGGNGTSHVLRALLPLFHSGKIASLQAVVNMTDDGGSTGRLREQYAVNAMGDLTRCMLALSKLRGDIRGERFLKALEYRFSSGDFAGHTLRNALLAALEITSDLDAAVATLARILQVPKYTGVIPATLEPVTQRVQVKTNGTIDLLGEGQHFISWQVDLQADSSWKPGDVRVAFSEEHVQLNPRAREALETATHVIVAPGHTYGSILPTLASLTLDDSFSLQHNDKAKLIIVMTLLTTPRHTVSWTGEDFVRVYESYLDRNADTVIANEGTVGDIELVPGQEWVEFAEHNHPYELLREDIVSTERPEKTKGDVIPRAIVVHDTDKMKRVFEKLVR